MTSVEEMDVVPNSHVCFNDKSNWKQFRTVSCISGWTHIQKRHRKASTILIQQPITVNKTFQKYANYSLKHSDINMLEIYTGNEVQQKYMEYNRKIRWLLCSKPQTQQFALNKTHVGTAGEATGTAELQGDQFRLHTVGHNLENSYREEREEFPVYLQLQQAKSTTPRTPECNYTISQSPVQKRGYTTELRYKCWLSTPCAQCCHNLTAFGSHCFPK